tara:strand:- start:99 stop:410 length:312 start_codon:yes stop_codon:yes gene_type:complete
MSKINATADIKSYHKDYYQKNKERIKERAGENYYKYISNDPNYVKNKNIQQKTYYQKNRDRILYEQRYQKLHGKSYRDKYKKEKVEKLGKFKVSRGTFLINFD